MITGNEISKVAEVLKERFPKPISISDYDWRNPSLNIIDCVLSLNRKYKLVVKPRIEKFKTKNPTCFSIEDLIALIQNYGFNYGVFTKNELDYNHQDRGRIISEVCQYLLLEISNDNTGDQLQKLGKWAKNARPGDVYFVGIKGFGLSGFQYLRMLFGAQTTKPDTHIINYLSKILNKKITDVQALYLLEKVASKIDLPLRDLDFEIWNHIN